MPTINRECCPKCGRSINSREIAIFASLVNALFTVWKECQEKGKYTFTRKEVKILFAGNENITARFGDMVLFGGILYHPDKKKGEYGFNIERAKQFFSGNLVIPTRGIKNPLTKEIVFSDHRYIHQIKGLQAFLNDNQEYIAKYHTTITI